MKLLRYGSPKHEKPGLLDNDGAIRDLSAYIDDLSPQTVTPKSLARLAALNSRELPLVGGTPRLGVPVNGIGKFIAIGLNYADHAKEANLPIPAEPPMFTKAISCLSGPNDDVMLPKDSLKGDWEVELGVIFGRTARYVCEEEALDYVVGKHVSRDAIERLLLAHISGSAAENNPQFDLPIAFQRVFGQHDIVIGAAQAADGLGEHRGFRRDR